MRDTPYSIQEHKHRFSAWAAGRAATVNGCRFTVRQAKAILEIANLNRLLLGPEQLPEPANIDSIHRTWRDAVICAAKQQSLTFRHGVAAKLINVYLKAAFVCGGHETDPRVQALHPPIDSLVLAELVRRNFADLGDQWHKARATRWSKWTSNQYEEVISSLRKALGIQPLWKIEEFWRGYQ